MINDLIIVKDEIIDSANPGQQAIEHTQVVDWQRHAQIMRKSWNKLTTIQQCTHDDTFSIDYFPCR